MIPFPPAFVEPDAETWEPGDPLFERHPYTRYLFNFRPMNDELEECRCGDAATWPTPRIQSHRLEEDPLADFIAEIIAWRSKNLLPEEQA